MDKIIKDHYNKLYNNIDDDIHSIENMFQIIVNNELHKSIDVQLYVQLLKQVTKYNEFEILTFMYNDVDVCQCIASNQHIDTDKLFDIIDKQYKNDYKISNVIYELNKILKNNLMTQYCIRI